MTCRGERNGKAKLRDAQVKAMRADYIPRVFGVRRVAKKWSVPYSTAYFIINHLRRADYSEFA